jgi:hypothetical protein
VSFLPDHHQKICQGDRSSCVYFRKSYKKLDKIGFKNYFEISKETNLKKSRICVAHNNHGYPGPSVTNNGNYISLL